MGTDQCKRKYNMGLFPKKFKLSSLKLFFFSSRRRHTRLTCDWSSDVCSSDLSSATSGAPGAAAAMVLILAGMLLMGSEERRVGKECRYRWSPYRRKKNENRSMQKTVQYG